MWKNKKILFIGAHTDDIELTCSGIIYKLKNDNVIDVLVFSPCEDFLLEKKLPVNTLVKEFGKAMEIINPSSYTLLRYPVRKLDEHRYEILNYLCKLNPDVVFFHSDNDWHQDHSVINKECMRAFGRKNIILITYEGENKLSSFWNLEIELTKEEKKFKQNILNCYESEGFKNIEIENKEKFKIIKWIWTN